MTSVLIDFVRWMNAAPGWMPLLVSAGLKATALLAMAWLASLLFRRSSAAMRHIVWTVALAGSLALPLLLPVMPRLAVPVLPPDTVAIAASSATALSTASPAAASDGPSAPAAAPEGRSAPAAARSWQIDLTSLVLVVWGAIAALLLTRLAWGIVRVRRLDRRTADAENWLPMARDLAERAGVIGRVTFAVGPPDAMPMTWCFLRAVVLLPEGADAWPEMRVRTVLLHELAHVRRYDCLTQSLAGAVCAIYWFNPLAWIAAGRLVAERERACDDAVLSAGADGGDYAEQLLDVARAARPHGVLTWASVSMARRSQLEGRLLAILDPDRPRRVPTRTAAAVLVVCLGVLVPSLAALNLGPREGDPVLPTASPSSLAALTRGAAQQTPPPVAAGQAVPRPQPAPRPTPTPTPTPTPEAEDEREERARKPVEQKVIDALTAALKDTDLQVREHALMALGQLKDRRATPALIAALGDASPDIRGSAAAALGELRDPAAVAPLMAALKDAAPEVREQAACALGELRDARSVEPLIAAVADADADVREQAIVALGQLRDRRATPVLVSALKDQMPEVRRQAASALGEMRDPASAPALAGVLTDMDAAVREGVVEALGELRDPAAVPGLIAALKDTSPDVQEEAAQALGQIRDRRAVEPLIAALASSSPDVRAQAAQALGELRDPRATDALMNAMKDSSPDVRKAAAFGLSQVVGRDQ